MGAEAPALVQIGNDSDTSFVFAVVSRMVAESSRIGPRKYQTQVAITFFLNRAVDLAQVPKAVRRGTTAASSFSIDAP